MHPPRPSILCLHGSGTSASIFYAQTRHLRTALHPHFDLVFIDAPLPSSPGPGVLPFFADSGPYYKWFSGGAIVGSGGQAQTQPQMQQTQTQMEIERVDEAVERGLKRQGRSISEMVGVLGFSQGCVAAALLLWLKSNGNIKYAGLMFGVMLCGGCRADVVDLIGGEHSKLRVPSMHLLGSEDPHREGGRMLAGCFAEDGKMVVEFAGGHHCPVRKGDVEMVRGAVVEAAGAGEGRGKVMERGWWAEMALGWEEAEEDVSMEEGLRREIVV